MMSIKLPLSTRTRLVLNPSIMSIITNGSSWGYFTPLTSFENTMSMFSLYLCFKGGAAWMLLTCLCCCFFRDLKDPPVVGPPLIILISPMAHFGRSSCFSSSLASPSGCDRP